jgi:hypothetical protein
MSIRINLHEELTVNSRHIIAEKATKVCTKILKDYLDRIGEDAWQIVHTTRKEISRMMKIGS